MKNTPVHNNPKKYDSIYSLGINCACAEYLRKNYLRKWSGPLDWVGSDDVYAPFKTILDEFRLFLDFSYLHKSEDGHALNVTWKHAQNQYRFVHDFFKTGNEAEQKQSVLQKYQRRVSRLLADLTAPKRVLFVWYGEDGSVMNPNEVVAYVRKIRQKYQAHIDFLFIMYEAPDNSAALLPDEIEKGIWFYRLPKTSLANRQDGYLRWDSPCIEAILSTVALAQKQKTWWVTLRKVGYQVLGAFIWNRSKRHKFMEDHVRNQ